MVAASVITILAFLHIITAVGWLGGAILFVSSIAPGLRSLSPAASLEFLAKVGPRTTRFFAGAATGTIVFGMALLSVLPGVTNTIYYGVGLGLIAYLTAILTILSFRKADKIARSILEGPRAGPPPPEFQNAMRTGGISVTLTVLLLIISLVFMVYAGSPF